CLTNIGQELHAHLLRAVKEAQDIWFDTPVRRFLEGEQPVALERAGRRPVLLGSCYHDLALALAVGLLRWIEERCSARAYLAKMRYSTAAGDDVAQRLTAIKAHVASETQRGIRCWRTEQNLAGAGDAPKEKGGETPKRPRGRKPDTDPKNDKR